MTLKNLPDDLLEELRAAAEQDRRSLNQQIMHLLAQALRARAVPSSSMSAEQKTQLAAWRKLAGKWASDVDAKTEATELLKRRSRGRDVAL